MRCLHLQGNWGLWVTQVLDSGCWVSGTEGCASGQRKGAKPRTRKTKIKILNPIPTLTGSPSPFSPSYRQDKKNGLPTKAHTLRKILEISCHWHKILTQVGHVGHRLVHGTHRCKAGAQTGKMTGLRSHSSGGPGFKSIPCVQREEEKGNKGSLGEAGEKTRQRDF